MCPINGSQKGEQIFVHSFQVRFKVHTGGYNKDVKKRKGRYDKMKNMVKNAAVTVGGACVMGAAGWAFLWMMNGLMLILGIA